jgi:hypothetical protein
VLGTNFITDVLLVSLRVDRPLTLAPGVLATDVALRTLSEALTQAACLELGLDLQELQAEYRPALTPAGRLGMEVEIFLYDTLPGGAGFARRAGDLGIALFKRAHELLVACPEKCDRSCYRCLRSYRNRFEHELEHELLDRHLSASLLGYLITGRPPVVDKDRMERSTDLLFQDLTRQSSENVRVERNRRLELPGLPPVTAPIYATNTRGEQFVIGLHSPLMPDEPSDDALREVKEYSTSATVVLVDELVVRRNLPAATRDAISILERKV